VVGVAHGAMTCTFRGNTVLGPGLRTNLGAALFFGVVGCGSEPPPASSSGTTTAPAEATDGLEADAPPPDGGWEDASLADTTVSGGFSVHLADTEPGGGWFTETDAHDSPQLEGSAFARAHRLSLADTAHDVIAVRIHGVPSSAGDWSVLELDVALPYWVAGDIPLDGTAAIGQLTRPDGSVVYLKDGTLTLTHPGVNSGDAVRGHFEAVPTWEVAR